MSRQIVYQKKRGYFFTTLKTESSKRYIIIGDYLLGELRRWQNQQIENEKLFDDSYVYVYREANNRVVSCSKALQASDAERVKLICTREDGQIYRRTAFAKYLRKEGLNSHSFRHTHATQLIESGVEAKAVAGRLGHADASITQNLYTHNTLKLQEKAAAVFKEILQTNS